MSIGSDFDDTCGSVGIEVTARVPPTPRRRSVGIHLASERSMDTLSRESRHTSYFSPKSWTGAASPNAASREALPRLRTAAMATQK